jgi:hybrid cluster-associated redox disulfide protein
MKNITKTKNKKSQKAAKSKIKKLITRDMTFAEVMQKYPKAAEIMMLKGLHCIGCGMAAYETIAQGSVMHGINPDKLVEELNKKLAKKK